MDFTIAADLATYSAEELAAKITEGRSTLDGLLALEDPSDSDVEQAEKVAEALASLATENTRRTTASADRASRMAALREKTAEKSAPVEEEEVEAEEPEVVEAEVIEEEPEQKPEPAKKTSTRATLAVKVARPAMPLAPKPSPITITASADVPGYSAGQVMGDWDALTEGFISKASSFPTVWGVEGAQPVRYPVSQFHMEFPEELVASGNRDADVVEYAGKESRLPGNSLTASGGWCAPSETIYDLCGGGSLDGLWNVPEIQVNRGGVRYTSGPDYAALYAAPFCQTETQAIAGTAKTCYEVPCPTFTDVRLDACGICLTSPILTEVGYPELVAAFVREAMIAHQHSVTAKLLASAIAGATAAPFGATARKSTAADTLDIIEWIANLARANYRVANNATIEVVMPFWAKGAMRSDLAMRTGVDLLGVTDAQLAGYFAARNVSVQYIFGYQPLATGATFGYPATMEVLVYPAGTFVKGTSPVINLDAVYDAASLKQNLYTALFYEQGVLLLKKCYTAYKATIPLCSAGVSGIANNAACLTAVP
jgi:hypothetical protein